MESEIRNATIIGVVLIALATVIMLAFGIFSIAKGVANEGTVQNQDAVANFVNSAMDDYNDKVVLGREVLSLLEKKGELSIFVSTNRMKVGKPVSQNKDLNVQFCNGRPYVNYGTLMSLAHTDSETLQTISANTAVTQLDDSLVLEEGLIYTEGYYCLTVEGMLVQNNDIGNCRKQGTIEYIDVSSKFEANLIKDISGAVIGVLFTQVSY